MQASAKFKHKTQERSYRFDIGKEGKEIQDRLRAKLVKRVVDLERRERVFQIWMMSEYVRIHCK